MNNIKFAFLPFPLPDHPHIVASMNQFALEIILFVFSVVGVLIGILGLPGNFVPVLAAFIAVLAG
ncbi:MAG: hypothetical protein CSA76_00455, partial [Spirochaetales bacterium]